VFKGSKNKPCANKAFCNGLFFSKIEKVSPRFQHGKSHKCVIEKCHPILSVLEKVLKSYISAGLLLIFPPYPKMQANTTHERPNPQPRRLKDK